MREHEAQMVMMNSSMMISAVILALLLGNVVRRITVDVFVFVYPGICVESSSSVISNFFSRGPESLIQPYPHSSLLDCFST